MSSRVNLGPNHDKDFPNACHSCDLGNAAWFPTTFSLTHTNTQKVLPVVFGFKKNTLVAYPKPLRGFSVFCFRGRHIFISYVISVFYLAFILLLYFHVLFLQPGPTNCPWKSLVIKFVCTNGGPLLEATECFALPAGDRYALSETPI